MKRSPFIMRRVGALHLFFYGFIPQNVFFFSNFPSFLLNVILLALMFKSWYKANAVWHNLLIKKGIKFLKKKIRRKRMRGEEEKEEEEENYENERTKFFPLHVTLFASLQIGFYSASLNKWVEL